MAGRCFIVVVVGVFIGVVVGVYSSSSSSRIFIVVVVGVLWRVGVACLRVAGRCCMSVREHIQQ